MSLLLILALSAFASSASVRSISDVTEQQRCDVTVGVTYPETAEEEPLVTCSSQCLSDDEQTWFMGSMYKHLAGLTALGLMVEVKYDKAAVIDCRLVPIQSTSSLLEAFQLCDNTVVATTARTFIPTGTNTGTFIPTGTNTGTFIPTGTNTGTVIPTGTNTGTFIPTGTNTGTFIPTGTNTGTFIPTGINTGTVIPTGINTGTFIPTGTNTGTIIPTGTNTGTFIPTGTNTGTFIPTGTNVGTSVPTGTNTGTFIPTGTNTGTFIPTGTSTGAVIPTETIVPTGTNIATSGPTEVTTVGTTTKDVIACEHKETSPSTPAPPTTTTIQLPTTTAHVCPEGWLLNAGSCYHLSASKGAWEEGRTYCSDNGGAYVKISSEEEWDFVKSMLSETTWIGLHDRDTEGSFVWDVDGSTPVYTKWHSDEPNDANGGEDCGEMNERMGFMWNDQPCRDARPFVCEMSANVLFG
ncbi:NAC-alpha domain-containing protein 1 [Penaeus vannamei]|uniref:NAC-alpha domain-containing protein 1 n=1 Tax=Penaeus vannamei TaxID=6689 RepID=A0A3R7QUN6_PENVA|nr:NAC-alpha domain-containing protein 1 [Penaeus vannamei]